MRLKTTITFFSLILTISCNKHDDTKPASIISTKTDTLITPNDINQPTISIGFYGSVLKWEGDFMPGPDTPKGKIYPIQNEIFIYKFLTMDSLNDARNIMIGLYTKDRIKTKPLFIIKPNNKGFYQINLPKGEYSDFIKYDSSLLYMVSPLILDKDTLIKRDQNLDFGISI